MPGTVYEYNPVTQIMAGFIGQPGKRVFYLQAWRDQETLTLLVEKEQLLAVALGIEQFITDVQEKMPGLTAPAAKSAEDLALRQPLDPAFRVGQMGLGYDQERDLVMLVAQEILLEGQLSEDAATARLFVSRAQILALAQHIQELVRQGRPMCGNCGQPIDPEGHFCPRSNGHKP